MQILLVYEMVPDRTQVYNLCINTEDAEKIIKCHGYYGNLTNTAEDVEPLVAEWLPNFLVNFKPIFDSSSVYADKPQLPSLINGETTVVVTGFIL